MSGLSKTKNKQLAAHARKALKGNWGLAIGTVLLYGFILYGLPNIIGLFFPVSNPINFTDIFLMISNFIFYSLIAGPLKLGLSFFVLSLSRKQNASFYQILTGFKRFGVAMGAYMLSVLFISLWSLLLIIPGIIAALSYSQIYYIIAENDSIGPLQAMRESKKMMRGNKWKLFCLSLRFAGWMILGGISFGIGLLWVIPYLLVSFAQFYDDISKKNSLVEETALEYDPQLP